MEALNRFRLITFTFTCYYVKLLFSWVFRLSCSNSSLNPYALRKPDEPSLPLYQPCLHSISVRASWLHCQHWFLCIYNTLSETCEAQFQLTPTKARKAIEVKPDDRYHCCPQQVQAMFVLFSQHNRTHGGCPVNRDVAETKTSVFSATNYLSTKTASCRKLSVSRHVVVFLPHSSWKEESKKGENPVSGVQSHRLTLVGLCNWTDQNPVVESQSGQSFVTVI